MPKNIFVPTKCLLQTLFACAIHGLHYASTEEQLAQEFPPSPATTMTNEPVCHGRLHMLK